MRAFIIVAMICSSTLAFAELGKKESKKTPSKRVVASSLVSSSKPSCPNSKNNLILSSKTNPKDSDDQSSKARDGKNIDI